MTTDTFDRPGFDIVRVISQTVAVLGRNFVSFGLLALVLVGLPTLVALLAQGGLMRGAVQGAQTGTFNFPSSGLTGVSLSGLATLVTTACSSPSVATASATRAGSSASGGSG